MPSLYIRSIRKAYRTVTVVFKEVIVSFALSDGYLMPGLYMAAHIYHWLTTVNITLTEELISLGAIHSIFVGSWDQVDYPLIVNMLDRKLSYLNVAVISKNTNDSFV